MKNIGGQAVIEGVMMKSQKAWTVAVRDQKGQIHLKKEPIHGQSRMLKLPLLRGVVGLFHALSLGIKALEFSASKAYEGAEEKPMSKTAITLTIMAAAVLGICLFILIPLYATKLIGIVFAPVSKGTLLFNLVDGLIRVLIFLLYVGAIGLWKEMRRVFEYHGAEHKVIHAYEAGRDLNPEMMSDISPLHPRCGTSFILIVMVISILIFSFIPQSWHFIWKFASRLILIPLIAGISYELLKLSAKMKANPIVRLLILPGLALQRLTTREPDEKQIEVALEALKAVLSFEEGNGNS